jgi:polyisoprenyl-teichoic acid--peptidoglycan teichoic acid transferase
MKKKAKIGSIIIITIIVAGILGGYLYTKSVFNKIARTELPMTDEELGITTELDDKPTVNAQQTEKVEELEKKEDIVNIAFFGLDRRNPDEASRSDSIMIVSLNRKSQKVKVASLMRDMYVPIPGKTDNRINAAYAFGGAALAIKTINSNFGLDVRDFVMVDFFGLQDIIDMVGGVEIDVKAYETSRCYVSKPGLQNLNGKQALAYSRIRYVGNGDYERTERQRRVLNVLFKKIKAQGITKLPGVINTLLPYVETSLSNDKISELAMDAFKFDTENIEQFRLPVDGTFKNQKIRGMAVLVPDIEENKIRLNNFIYNEGTTAINK